MSHTNRYERIYLLVIFVSPVSFDSHLWTFKYFSIQESSVLVTDVSILDPYLDNVFLVSGIVPHGVGISEIVVSTSFSVPLQRSLQLKGCLPCTNYTSLLGPKPSFTSGLLSKTGDSESPVYRVVLVLLVLSS